MAQPLVGLWDMVPPVRVMEEQGPAERYLGANLPRRRGARKRTVPPFWMDSTVAEAMGTIFKGSPAVKTIWSILVSAAAALRRESRLDSRWSGCERSQRWPYMFEAFSG